MPEARETRKPQGYAGPKNPPKKPRSKASPARLAALDVVRAVRDRHAHRPLRPLVGGSRVRYEAGSRRGQRHGHARRDHRSRAQRAQRRETRRARCLASEHLRDHLPRQDAARGRRPGRGARALLRDERVGSGERGAAQDRAHASGVSLRRSHARPRGARAPACVPLVVGAQAHRRLGAAGGSRLHARLERAGAAVHRRQRGENLRRGPGQSVRQAGRGAGPGIGGRRERCRLLPCARHTRAAASRGEADVLAGQDPRDGRRFAAGGRLGAA